MDGPLRGAAAAAAQDATSLGQGAQLRRPSGASNEPVIISPTPKQEAAAPAAPLVSSLGAQVCQHVAQAGDQLRRLYASAVAKEPQQPPQPPPPPQVFLAQGRQDLAATEAASSAPPLPPPLYQSLPGVVPFHRGRAVEPPPTYDDVINPHAAPPAYQSLFGQMREARKSSRSLLELLARRLIILATTLGCTLVLASAMLIPFTMIIIGIIFINDCNIEYIPLHLLLGGLVCASKNLHYCYRTCKKQSRAERRLAAAAAAATSSSRSELGAGDSGQLVGQRESLCSPPGWSGGSFDHLEGQRRRADNGAGGSAGGSSLTAGARAASSLSEQELLRQAVERAARRGRHPAGTLGGSPGERPPNSLEPAHMLINGQNSFQNDTSSNNNNNNQPDSISASSASIQTDSEAEMESQDLEQAGLPFGKSLPDFFFNLLLVVWFTLSCIIVIRNQEPDFVDTTSVYYCNRTVYMYFFWLVSATFILLMLCTGTIICLLVSTALTSGQRDELDLA